MPKKLNKGGNQQEYIPAGNGDESGEYADDSGSNKHFTSFKQPEQTGTETTETIETPTEKPISEVQNTTNEEPSVDEEKEKLVQSLDKKWKKEIVKFIYERKDRYTDGNYEKLISQLRYYTGSFGDLSNYTDEQLNSIISNVMGKQFETAEEPLYIKKGSKWYLTREKGLNEYVGETLYTKDEKEAIENAKLKKTLEGSQKQNDLNIQKTMGEKTVVCFGKGYKKEDLQEIENATKNLVNDFDDLKGFVSAMGDRTNLENYLNARRQSRELTEDEIKEEMEKISSYTIFYGSNPEQRLREAAIRQLKGNIKITRHNDAYAYWSPTQKMMIFMPKMRNASESLKRDYENNFHPTDKNISVYYHEMGHAVDSMISNQLKKAQKMALGDRYYKLHEIRSKFIQQFNDLRNSNLNVNYSTEFAKAYNEKHGTSFETKRDIEKSFRGNLDYWEEKEINKVLNEKGIKKYNVSEYADTNDAEFFAECFAGHYCNAGNETCEKLFNVVKEYYNSLREFTNENTNEN